MGDQRESVIDDLSQRITKCRLCRDPSAMQSSPDDLLPHEPRPVIRLSSTARICIAGQAPGNLVHQTGIPFNDPSGDRLRQWMGVDRQTFYDQRRIAIVPMGFCFPGYDSKGGDLPPRIECQRTWHRDIFQSMPQVRLFLVIGRYAQAYHLGKMREKTLTATVKKTLSYWQPGQQPSYLPLPHPSWRNTAWLKRNPWFETDILPILQQEVRRYLL